jgi:hypothetical protein
MRTKGIGPQGLGTKGNNGYHIGSPAKQAKRYSNLAKRMENFNQDQDTLITSRGTNRNVLRAENNFKASVGHKKGLMDMKIKDSKTLRGNDGTLQYITQHEKTTTKSPAKQTARSKRLYARSEKNAIKGRKAVDEGRDKRATRLLKRAARQEDKAIRLEEKAKKRKKC